MQKPGDEKDDYYYDEEKEYQKLREEDKEYQDQKKELQKLRKQNKKLREWQKNHEEKEERKRRADAIRRDRRAAIIQQDITTTQTKIKLRITTILAMHRTVASDTVKDRLTMDVYNQIITGEMRANYGLADLLREDSEDLLTILDAYIIPEVKRLVTQNRRRSRPQKMNPSAANVRNRVILTTGSSEINDMTWEHKDAAKSVAMLCKKYGVPKVLEKKKGGVAIWTADQLTHTCFVRIEVLDEQIPHCKPAKHVDNIYHYINYDVSPEKYLDVMSLSGSVAYDPLKKWLRARCASEKANIATLAMATQIGEGNVTLKFVQAEGLYKTWILSTKKAGIVKTLYALLCFNIKHQRGNPRSDGYWPLAFPEGCAN